MQATSDLASEKKEGPLNQRKSSRIFRHFEQFHFTETKFRVKKNSTKINIPAELQSANEMNVDPSAHWVVI